MRGLDGKVAIITGGGGGIGGATCRRFAEEGAKIGVYDLDKDSAEAVAEAVEKAGGKAHAASVDLTDYAALEKTVAATAEALGPIDILVNNIGWDLFQPFLKTEPDHWQKLISINLITALNALHIVLPGMVERQSGRVVTVSSDAGRTGSSGESVYSACKGGLIALSKTLAREHARHNVTFNVVCPGLTETGMLDSFLGGSSNPDKLREAYRRAIPLGRLGVADDIPGAIAFLSSDDAAFITGQVLSVSGGLTMND